MEGWLYHSAVRSVFYKATNTNQKAAYVLKMYGNYVKSTSPESLHFKAQIYKSVNLTQAARVSMDLHVLCMLTLREENKF